jgi:hypothetical protein
MDITFQNLFSLTLIGAALLAGLLALRWIFKLAWKIFRVVLIGIAIILFASFLLGFL